MDRPLIGGTLAAGFVLTAFAVACAVGRGRGEVAHAMDDLSPASSSGSGAATPQPQRTVLIGGVPHVLQKPDFCGEADVEMYLRFRGKAITQDQVFGLSGMPPERGMGATTRELRVALERLGFDVGPVWHPASPRDVERVVENVWERVYADLTRQVPSIVCMRTGDGPRATEHFRLVLGYDATTDEIVYHEPAEADGAYRRMPKQRFFARWPLKDGADARTVIRLRLEAREILEPSPRTGFTGADFAQHVMALKPHVPQGFTLLIEPPFVVIGNGPPKQVQHRAENTVRWAVEMLKQEYFQRDPAKILDIWLLEDAATYQEISLRLTGSRPTTPYGFYSADHGALIMNISTGGGTLVHEIVHPFVEANFPNCPSWFNEGLGSLYEQSEERDGHIVGVTNWRLAGLQQAIRRRSVPSFDRLTGTTETEFYRADPGTNYAQARYLLYYLQEHDRLRKFYEEFVAHQGDDPTGYQTLARILGHADMTEFQRQWEHDVLALHFP